MRPCSSGLAIAPWWVRARLLPRPIRMIQTRISISTRHLEHHPPPRRALCRRVRYRARPDNSCRDNSIPRQGSSIPPPARPIPRQARPARALRSFPEALSSRHSLDKLRNFQEGFLVSLCRRRATPSNFQREFWKSRLGSARSRKQRGARTNSEHAHDTAPGSDIHHRHFERDRRRRSHRGRRKQLYRPEHQNLQGSSEVSGVGVSFRPEE